MATKKELVAYINSNLDKGYSEQQIREALKKAGNSKTIIDQAFKQAKKERTVLPASMPAPAKVQSNQSTQTTTSSSPEQPLSADTEKILSALSYPIGIIAIVLLIIAKKENKLGKFHGFQALFWNIAYFLILILITLLIMPLIVSVAWFLFWLPGIISALLWIGFIVLSILFAIKAYKGETFKIPVIYNIVPAADRL